MCTTKGQLADALGGPVLPDDPQWPAWACLCLLDIPATARMYGYTVDRFSLWSVEFVKDASAPGAA
jgi:hypothetical protein